MPKTVCRTGIILLSARRARNNMRHVILSGAHMNSGRHMIGRAHHHMKPGHQIIARTQMTPGRHIIWRAPNNMMHNKTFAQASLRAPNTMTPGRHMAWQAPNNLSLGCHIGRAPNNMTPRRHFIGRAPQKDNFNNNNNGKRKLRCSVPIPNKDSNTSAKRINHCSGISS